MKDGDKEDLLLHLNLVIHGSPRWCSCNTGEWAHFTSVYEITNDESCYERFTKMASLYRNQNGNLGSNPSHVTDNSHPNIHRCD